jgi:predicted GNAT superfamily acetyltransferase
VLIRQCTTFEDYAACIELQRTVWGFDDLDITPLRSFVIARRGGGFTLGAFDENEQLRGFAHALPAFDDARQPYFYSQMLAVLPDARNEGIGARLKLAQREHAIARSIPLIAWTFDPLQSRNAYLNLVKLGGVVRTYLANYYGNSSTSALHRGLDTDRLFVEWWVRSPDVARALAGESRNEAPAAIVEVPRDIETIKAASLDDAREWQIRIRTGFETLLSQGLFCAGFSAGREGQHSQYHFFQDRHED